MHKFLKQKFYKQYLTLICDAFCYFLFYFSVLFCFVLTPAVNDPLCDSAL